MIPGNTEIPADIQADAKQLFPMYEWSNRSLILPPTVEKSAFGQKEEYEAYIQGRMDQRTESANDAIEFAIWTHHEDRYYQDKRDCLTTQQLYELWQKSKNK